MFPSRTIVIPTNHSAKHLSPDPPLDSTKGLSALLVWVIAMSTSLIPSVTAKTELSDQEQTASEPGANDVFDCGSHVSPLPEPSTSSLVAPSMSPPNPVTDVEAKTSHFEPSRPLGQPLAPPLPVPPSLHKTAATRAENATPTYTTTNTTLPLQHAQPLVTKHNKKQQQQQQQHISALINRSSRNNPSPGNINQPHCPHCALNGHIRNNHGHGTLKPCSDTRTASDEQQALLSNFVALMNGTASQHQRDSLNVSMDSSIFDASTLASMNSGLGAPVPDADAADEARRVRGGGHAPKN